MKFHHIEIWYDRLARTWVLQYKDAKNNQLGDAEYYATKDEAQRAERSHLIARYLAAYKKVNNAPCGSDIIYVGGFFKFIHGYTRICVRKHELLTMCENLEG